MRGSLNSLWKKNDFIIFIILLQKDNTENKKKQSNSIVKPTETQHKINHATLCLNTSAKKERAV